MRQDLIDNGFIVVEDFLTPEQAANLYQEFKDLYKNKSQGFTYDEQCPNSPAIYNAPMFLTLLLQKLPFMSEFVGEEVYPTYCYARHYRNNAVLAKHVDRASSEVSITAHLGGDKSWKIFFEKPNGEEIGLDLKPGQAALYLGCTAHHWREGKYEGREYGQVFLHYVRAKGEYSWACFDKRR